MQRSRILVVDDEPSIIRIFEEAFESRGLEVIGAADGSEALKKLAAGSPDVIFSDLIMTTLGGFELLERAKERVPDVPFVVMTAYSDKSKLARALKLGAFELIDKPFLIDELDSLVTRALAQRQLYRERRLRETHSQSIERFSRLLNASRSFDDLIACLRLELGAALGVRNFSLFLCEPSTRKLAFSCSGGSEDPHSEALVAQMQTAIASQLPALGHAPDSESVSLPLLVRSDLVGVLNLDEKVSAPAFDPIDLGFFTIAAGHLASAVAVRQEALQLATALKELKKSKSMLVEAQAIARVGSWRWVLSSHEVRWSDELVRIYGRPLDPLASHPIPLDRIPLEDHQFVVHGIEEVVRSGQPITFEHRVLDPAGNRIVLNHVRAIVDAQGVATKIVGTVQDITERKQMETRLLLADRMASAGILAAGMAHEVNNPLAYVVANLDFIASEITALEPQLPKGRLDEMRQALSDSRHGAGRVTRIVSDLRTISRADDESRGPVNLNRAIDSSLKIAANEIRHRARLLTELGELPLIEGNEARLGQVFLNLLVNAAQAMPLGAASDNELKVKSWFDATRKLVIAEVSDTGAGIPSEIISRVFDPFFTTKPIGAGTGLGLSICHGIVAALGGEISVQSQVGKGTTFRVLLPATTKIAPPAPASVPRESVPRQRVLVIDDEPMVGVSLRRLLATDHDVVSEQSAVTALCRIDAGEPFDVIVCDLMMPNVSGIDFYQALEQRKCSQRVIFMTGGAFTTGAAEFVARTSAPVVAKPIDGQLLRSMITAIGK